MGLLGSVRSAAAGLAWYVRAVSGEDAYERYLAHHQSAHGAGSAVPALTEREFWRDRTDRQDTNPQGRCC
jgi:uncharacterized short protein YbdD (DUF466 family)